MARVEAPAPLQLALLDRLLDDDPSNEREAPRTLAQSVRDLERAIERDLRDLLNTRVRARPWSKELEKSLAAYGVPDLTGANLASNSARAEFLRTVEAVVRRFEPRFDPRTIRVVADAATNELGRQVRFRIEAMVMADPVPQAVVFDSELEPAQRRFNLSVRS